MLWVSLLGLMIVVAAAPGVKLYIETRPKTGK
jgi:hypothetical protein